MMNLRNPASEIYISCLCDRHGTAEENGNIYHIPRNMPKEQLSAVGSIYLVCLTWCIHFGVRGE